MSEVKRLAIVGSGKMGRIVAQLAPDHKFQVMLQLSRTNNAGGQGITAAAFAGIDVAIEFSTPQAAPENLKQLARLGIPTVTGTTGWTEQLESVRKEIESCGSALVWSPNFSVGVAVFRRIVMTAANLLKGESGYGAWAWEIHHDAKKDAPSGTLLHLVKSMKEAGYPRLIDTSSNRSGRHPGTHEVGFDSQSDTITLRHTARSREGFGEGALRSAAWVVDKKGIYTFEDVLFGFASQDGGNG